MYRRLRHTQRRLFSLRHWRVRLVFWLGALLLGALAAGFALAATFADKSFHRLVDGAPFLALLLPPLGLIATAWIAYSVSKIVCREAIYRALAKNYLRESPPPASPSTEKPPAA